MSAILTIVMEKEIRDYANGKVSPDRETDIRQAIENDEKSGTDQNGEA